jgi:hypothetical protein
LDSYDEGEEGVGWVSSTVSSLIAVRNALWPVLEPLGTVKTNGAFYFLVPIPSEVKFYFSPQNNHFIWMDGVT